MAHYNRSYRPSRRAGTFFITLTPMAQSVDKATFEVREMNEKDG